MVRHFLILSLISTLSLQAKDFFNEDIKTFGQTQLSVWQEKYDDPNNAVDDVNKMIEDAYKCEGLSSEQFFSGYLQAQSACYISRTYHYENGNFLASSLTALSHVCLTSPKVKEVRKAFDVAEKEHI